MNKLRAQIDQISPTQVVIRGIVIRAHNIDLSFTQGEPDYSNTHGSFVIIASEARADEVVIFDDRIAIVALDRSGGILVDSWEEFFEDCRRRGYAF